MGNTYLYIGDDGISADSSVKLTQGKEVDYSQIKNTFIENGGYLSGKSLRTFIVKIKFLVGQVRTCLI